MSAPRTNSLAAKSYYRWIILIACILVYCTSQLGSWNYAGVSKYLIDDLGIGKPEIGLLGSAFFYAYAIAQIPWGTATDVLGGRRVIPVGVAALALFLTGFAFMTTFRQAILWRTLMGFVAAAGFVPISSVLAKWFGKKELGFAMEMFSGVGGGLGQGITFFVVPLMAFLIPDGAIFGLRLSGWRSSTFVMGIVVLVIAIASALLLRSNSAAISPRLVKTAEPKKEQRELQRRCARHWKRSGALDHLGRVVRIHHSRALGSGMAAPLCDRVLHAEPWHSQSRKPLQPEAQSPCSMYSDAPSVPRWSESYLTSY